LARREGGYRIEDCGAQFCDDNDASLKVYDSIEEAIEAGKESITVELDGESKKITWTVTESGDEDETEAQQLIAEHPNAAELMTILDNSAYPSDQDWDLGQTTWTLDDGSKIRICGNDVEAIADEGEDEDEDDGEDVLVGATKFALTNSETGERCEYTANDLWTAQMLAAEDHGGEPGDWTDGESEPAGDDELGGSQVTIRDIALQFDRLCPSQVDTTISGNGHQESGHVGHDTDGVLSIGWYCAGGNAGESLCEIALSTIKDLYKRLASLPDGSLDDGGIDEIVREFNGKW
jgi:hypothetical protein